MPRLTIAIPTLNRAKLLSRAIDSVLAQTSSDIEVLVSDNGSTDETPSVIARYSDPRLRIFRHQNTMPAGTHGRFLIEQARGEFFLGLSDDDFLEPQFASEVLAAYDRNPNVVFVYTGCAVHYEDVQVPSLVGPPIEPGAELLLNHYSGLREISWCACATRVSLLRELGPQPPECIIGDMFFWTRMALRGPVACVPELLSHYILLREQAANDNVSHGTPPVVWADEAAALGDRVVEGLSAAGAPPPLVSKVQSSARTYVARSAANQFVWTRIRGASLFQEFRWLLKCLPHLALSWTVLSRVGAAFLLPPLVLRRALVRSAASMAVARRNQHVNCRPGASAIHST